MSKIKGKDTTPELAVRRLLHKNGYRYRLHVKDLPGKPDIVMKKYNTVIFVHGCFWHGHEDCPRFALPKTKESFWGKKINTNRERDKVVDNALRKLKWRILHIWECSLRSSVKLDENVLLEKTNDFLNSTRYSCHIRGKRIKK